MEKFEEAMNQISSIQSEISKLEWKKIEIENDLLKETKQYAKKNGLGAFKKTHKGTNQTYNFIKYVEIHQRLTEIHEKIEKQLESNLSFSELRKILEDIPFSYSDNFSFPNLYHYKVEELIEISRKQRWKVRDMLPEYKVQAPLQSGKWMELDFKTAYDLKAYHSDMGGLETYFEGKKLSTEEIFEAIEEKENKDKRYV